MIGWALETRVERGRHAGRELADVVFEENGLEYLFFFARQRAPVHGPLAAASLVLLDRIGQADELDLDVDQLLKLRAIAAGRAA